MQPTEKNITAEIKNKPLTNVVLAVLKVNKHCKSLEWENGLSLLCVLSQIGTRYYSEYLTGLCDLCRINLTCKFVSRVSYHEECGGE